MNFHDLAVGETVSLEMISGANVYEIRTTVAGMSKDSSQTERLLLKPFSYKGKVLDLGNRFFDGIIFNIHAVGADHVRQCWRNIKIRPVDYKGDHYYAVMAESHHAISVSSERRSDSRLVVNLDGTITMGESGEKKKITVYDISDGGVSFYSKAELPDMLSARCQIEFCENVHDNCYNIEVDCQCVRAQQTGERFLYGCKVGAASRETLNYIFIKHLIEKQNLAEETKNY